MIFTDLSYLKQQNTDLIIYKHFLKEKMFLDPNK